MSEQRNREFVVMCSAIFLILVFSNVYGNFYDFSQERIKRPRSSYEAESLMYSDNEDQGNSQENWNRRFNPQYKRAVKEQPSKRDGNRAARNAEQSFVFPDMTDTHLPRTEKRFMTVATRYICNRTDFCVNVPNYPIDIAKKIISSIPNYKNYEFQDKLDLDATQRMDMSEEQLCPAKRQVIYPRMAQNMNNTWVLIINTDEFLQGIYTETCLNEGQTCKEVGQLSAGYVTWCKQSFVYRQLIGFTSENQTIRDNFRFPSGCCCHVNLTGIPVMDRFNTATSFQVPPKKENKDGKPT